VKPEAAFIDRDGTINHKAPEGDYVKSVSEFSFLPGAVQGLRLLTDNGVRIVIVTNQRGIARGVMTASDLAEIHRWMLSKLSAAGAHVEAIYHCPHDHGQCSCRKPQLGMFLDAERQLPGLELSRSVVVGDSETDMQAGERLGVPRVLIGAGPVTPEVSYCAPSLLEAARWIISGYQRPSTTLTASRQRIDQGSVGQRSAIVTTLASETGSPAPRRYC